MALHYSLLQGQQKRNASFVHGKRIYKNCDFLLFTTISQNVEFSSKGTSFIKARWKNPAFSWQINGWCHGAHEKLVLPSSLKQEATNCWAFLLTLESQTGWFRGVCRRKLVLEIACVVSKGWIVWKITRWYWSRVSHQQLRAFSSQIDFFSSVQGNTEPTGCFTGNQDWATLKQEWSAEVAKLPDRECQFGSQLSPAKPNKKLENPIMGSARCFQGLPWIRHQRDSLSP